MSKHESKRKPVTRGNPCPVCEGTDGCSVGDDDSIMCRRRTGEQSGFVYMGQAKADPQWALYRAADDPAIQQRNGRAWDWHVRARSRANASNGTVPSPPPAPDPQWAERAAYYAKLLTPARQGFLADDLSLPDAAISHLPVGYCDNGPHVDAETGKPLGECWTFPEVDAAGTIIGIACRYRSGHKLNWGGGHRGLYVPAGWRDTDATIYLCEGPSDTLALSAMGLTAIGRPSNTGGVEHLTQLLADVPAERPIVVLGEIDPKQDGKWPGKDGAIATAERLSAALKREIPWALPPDGAKDARKWFVEREPDLTCLDGLHQLGEQFTSSLKPLKVKEQPAIVALQPYTFDAIDSATFFAGSYKLKWIVRKLFVANQPAVVGGHRKTLKTSVAADLAVSLGSGRPFLGVDDFHVYRKMRVAFISGESGEAVLQDTGRRICAARGIDPASLDVLWGFRLPQLANLEHMGVLGAGLKQNNVEVLILDPLYLCLLAGVEGADIDAANLFQIGPLLMQISQTCKDVGCTPILLHHSRKNLASPNEPMELEDLAFAGIQEFARQWLLVSRQEKYDPANPGEHKLWLSVGGSAGQGGLWSVQVQEGQLDEEFGGRRWDVTVEGGSKARQDAASHKEDRKAKKEDARLLNAIDSLAGNVSGTAVGYTKARDIANMRNEMMTRVVHRLKEAGLIEELMADIEIGSGAKRRVKAIRRVVNL